MSATGLPGYFQSGNHRDEVNYWKDLAFAYKKENEQLRQQLIKRQSPARKRPASSVEGVTDKKRHKTSSMDPLDSEILHEHVHRYIAQHLTGKDLLPMSEVSKSWNEFAEDQKIGDKVRVKINFKSIISENLQIVTDSSRNYKEISMEPESESNSAAMGIFADTAEKMTIKIKNTKHNGKGRDFSKLKSLDLTLIPGRDSWILKSTMEHLEDLKLATYGQYDEENDEHGLDFLLNFLSKQKNLKRLDVSDFDCDFLEYFTEEPPFQLEYLKANLTYNQTFLNSQRESLQTIVCLSGADKYEARSFLTEFPKLTSLEISDCNDQSWENLYDYDEELPINTTIKKLKLQGLVCHDILLALPELTFFYTERVTIELMELITLNLRKLKELKCKNIEDGAWERYEEIKRETVEGTNLEIKLIVVEIEEE